jgi:O-antigen/teichoic acid export membrane protein
MIEFRSSIRRVRIKVFSDDTLTKKASLNSLASALDYAARFIVGFVVNPILVLRLGDAGFGTWQVLQRLIGQATPTGGRASEALKWTVASRQAFSDFEEKRRQVGSAVAVWFIFLPIVALLGGLLAWFAPVWLHTEGSSYSSVRLAASLLVANLILTNLSNVPRSVLQGENLGYKRVGLSTLLVFVGGALSVGAVLLGTGIEGLAAATLATTILTGLLFMLIVRHYVTWFGIARPSFHAMGRFLRLSGWFLLWNLVMQMMTGSDVIVLGIAGSTEQVTSYTLARYVPLVILAVVTIGIFGIMPGLAGMVGAGDLQRAVTVRNETMSLVWLLATVFGSVILIWEESFLRLWVGNGYYLGPWATLLIVLMIFQFALIRTDSNVIDLTLDLRQKVLLGLVSAGLSVALAWGLLTGFGMGVVGLATGFIIGRTVQSIAYPWMVGRILEIRALAQLKGMVRPGLMTCALFTTATALERIVAVSSWPGLLLASCSSTIGLGLVAFLGGLSEQQRRRVRKRVQRVLRLA